MRTLSQTLFTKGYLGKKLKMFKFCNVIMLFSEIQHEDRMNSHRDIFLIKLTEDENELLRSIAMR